MRKEYEAAHAVSEEVAAGPPSRRANATLTPCPNGNHLWCIGGEFFSEDKKAVRAYMLLILACEFGSSFARVQYFYNDVFRYTPEKVRRTLSSLISNLTELILG